MATSLAEAVVYRTESSASGTPRIEARSAPRVALEAEVTFESDHNFYTGLTRNISTGGLFVATHALLPKGALVRLRFTVPGYDAPIESLAEVSWVREPCFSSLPPGMGLRFLDLAGPALLAVQLFTTRRDSLFYED